MHYGQGLEEEEMAKRREETLEEFYLALSSYVIPARKHKPQLIVSG